MSEGVKRRTIVRFPDGSEKEFTVDTVQVEAPSTFVLASDGEAVGLFPAAGPQAVSIWHPDGPNKVQLVHGKLS